MSTTTEIDLLDDPATIEADNKTVMEAIAMGLPIDPEICDRMIARTDRRREAIRERLGTVQIVDQIFREMRG